MLSGAGIQLPLNDFSIGWCGGFGWWFCGEAEELLDVGGIAREKRGVL